MKTDRGRDWCDMATSQGMLEVPGAGGGGKDPPPESQEGAGPALTWISASWPPDLGENILLLF